MNMLALGLLKNSPLPAAAFPTSRATAGSEVSPRGTQPWIISCAALNARHNIIYCNTSYHTIVA